MYGKSSMNISYLEAKKVHYFSSDLLIYYKYSSFKSKKILTS